MKIAIISDYSVDKPYGGLQTHVYHLARALSSFSVQTHIITLSSINDDFKEDNLNIHLLKRSSRFPRLFTIMNDSKSVLNKIKEINPDIVHVQGTHYPFNYISRRIPEKYPVIITVHGIIANEYKYNAGLNFFGGFISYLLEKYAFRKAKNIIVCSEVMKEQVHKLTDAQVYVVPNGVNCKGIGNINTNIKIKHPSIIYIGLLEKIKGVDVLIKATAIIKEKLPYIHVYIAGEGSQEDSLKQLVADLRLNDIIDFLGYLHDKDKYSYLKSADLCIVPSRYESFGIIILEAMACGIPIIASGVGNIPYLLKTQKNGLVVHPDDPKTLACEIIKLIKNKELQSKMKLNSLNIIKGFDWELIAKQTIAVYKEIMNGS